MKKGVYIIQNAIVGVGREKRENLKIYLKGGDDRNTQCIPPVE